MIIAGNGVRGALVGYGAETMGAIPQEVQEKLKAEHQANEEARRKKEMELAKVICTTRVFLKLVERGSEVEVAWRIASEATDKLISELEDSPEEFDVYSVLELLRELRR